MIAWHDPDSIMGAAKPLRTGSSHKNQSSVGNRGFLRSHALIFLGRTHRKRQGSERERPCSEAFTGSRSKTFIVHSPSKEFVEQTEQSVRTSLRGREPCFTLTNM
jgi:hypothetical protein